MKKTLKQIFTHFGGNCPTVLPANIMKRIDNFLGKELNFGKFATVLKTTVETIFSSGTLASSVVLRMPKDETTFLNLDPLTTAFEEMGIRFAFEKEEKGDNTQYVFLFSSV